MTDYTYNDTFAGKDALPTGSPGKVIKATEFNTEFNNIETAVNSKFDKAGGTFTGNIIGLSATFSGTSTLATVDINGGAVDGTVIGGSTAAAGSFTTVNASGNITGNLVGNVTGNVTGDVTGNLTGNVTGNLTGNVTGDLTGDVTGNVVTAAQPNITSVGTLTSLAVENATGELATFTATTSGHGSAFINAGASFSGIGTDRASHTFSIQSTGAGGQVEIATGSLGLTGLLVDASGLTTVKELNVEASADPKITLTDTGTWDASIRIDGANGALVFENAKNTERMRIDSAGNVGVGAVSPTHRLVVDHPSDNYQLAVGSNPGFRYEQGRNSADGLYYFYGQQTGFQGYVFTGVNGEQARISSTGDWVVAAGDLILNSGNAQIRSSGSGVEAELGLFLGASASLAFKIVNDGSGNLQFRDDSGDNVLQINRSFLSPGRVIINGGPVWTSGTGSPEGSVTAPVGSFYSRTDGGAGTSFYVKESGTGNTGWVAK